VIGLLRRELRRVARNARVFALRSRARPTLLSARSWAELAEIEAELQDLLQHTLRLELHVEPWTALGRVRTGIGSFLDSLRGERRLLERLLDEAVQHPIERWRSGVPQLEDALWPFLGGRTRYLANMLALALDEPAPFPPLLWQPRRRQFTS
jgi:hypothetical protein